MKRVLNPYEINHLRRFGVDPETITDYGEMPVEYITGRAEIFGRDFIVNPHVLIPRVEEEDMIKLALSFILPLPSALSPLPLALCPHPSSLLIADMGCGSGVIGISLYLELLKRQKKPTVYLSDVSDKAISVTEKNISRLIKARPFPKRPGLLMLKSNLLASYPRNLKFDLIVANLPYIPSGRIAKLPPSVRNFEPHLALDGGPDGLLYINRLIKQAPEYLKPSGKLIMEIDDTHQITDLEIPSVFTVSARRDQFGKNRFIVLSRK